LSLQFFKAHFYYHNLSFMGLLQEGDSHNHTTTTMGEEEEKEAEVNTDEAIRRAVC
jgi:hypothetical protein